MIGYICTLEQKEQIKSKNFATNIVFNCVQDIDGVWFLFLSEQDIPLVIASEYAWVLDLPQSEYIPPPPPPFPI
jgi:hypothetical protein